MNDTNLLRSILFFELWKRYFPEALQVRYYVAEVIIELPEINFEEHVQRLENPNSLTNSNAKLFFTNGLRPLTQLARPKKPQPKLLGGEEDDTDYIKSVGFASPGLPTGFGCRRIRGEPDHRESL